jgi:glycosyltransferase involved in cell wall biosynthesis
MAKKILFLTPEFPPSKLTGAIRPSKFAKYLDRFGWDVTVLTFDHQDNTHLDLLKDLKNVRIEKCGVPKKIIVNDLGISYLFQSYKQAMKLAKEIKPDYVLVSMPTFMNSILAYIIKKRFSIDYVLDYRDLWVGDPYPARGFKSKVFRFISKVIEPIVLKSAYLSYYVSDAMLADQMKLYPWLKDKKTTVISTGYDHEDISHITPSDNKNGYIAHIGNADPDMNLSDFIEIVEDKRVQELLLEKKLRYLFVGSKNHFMQELLDDSLKDFFEFKEYLPHNDALQLMADSNGLMILGSNSPQRLNRKVFEYTALNKNIFYLGNTKSPTANIVKESVGIISNVDNKIKKMIEFLKKLSDEKVIMNMRYSKEKLVEKLVESF